MALHGYNDRNHCVKNIVVRRVDFSIIFYCKIDIELKDLHKIILVLQSVIGFTHFIYILVLWYKK